jgi:hypothetical protein
MRMHEHIVCGTVYCAASDQCLVTVVVVFRVTYDLPASLFERGFCEVVEHAQIIARGRREGK